MESQLSPAELVGRVLQLFAVTATPRACEVGLLENSGPSVDAQRLLSCLLDNQERLWPDRILKREALTYIHELKEVRNKWAHASPLSMDDAERASDTAGRLLRLIGCDSGFVDEVRQGIRRLLIATSLDPVVPSAQGTGGTVTVIACSKNKLTHAARAIELYTGPMFRSSLTVASAESSPIFILSTRYGLIGPDAIIEPYEQSLDTLSLERRSALITTIRLQAQEAFVPKPTSIQVLGGQAYVALLREALSRDSLAISSHPRWREVYERVYPRR